MAKRVEWYYHRNGCTACERASRFLAAHAITPGETVPASRRLGREEAVALIEGAQRIFVAKGKQRAELSGGAATPAAIDALLGPTGNLRAPTLRVGRTVLVGFDEQTFRAVLT